MSTDSVLRKKCLAFSLRVIRLYKYLVSDHKEFVISKQILRSGTSIGANVTEAVYGSSKKDFAAKLQIAKKEAAETCYWLELLYGGEYIDKKLFQSFRQDCEELLSIICATLKNIEG